MKKVAILGGTGNIGEGLARRICLGGKFDVAIGSRGADKAEAAAEGVRTCLAEHGCTATTCSGGTNADVCSADILILSLPFERIESTIETIGKSAFENKVIISLINPMIRNPKEKYFLPDAPAEGSAALSARCSY